MTLREASNIFKDILRTRCDELLIDQTTQLEGDDGMLREIAWCYKCFTFWVEYVYFEVPGKQANSLLKDVIIFLKLKFKTMGKEQWVTHDHIDDFLEVVGQKANRKGIGNSQKPRG